MANPQPAVLHARLATTARALALAILLDSATAAGIAPVAPHLRSLDLSHKVAGALPVTSVLSAHQHQLSAPEAATAM